MARPTYGKVKKMTLAEKREHRKQLRKEWRQTPAGKESERRSNAAKHEKFRDRLIKGMRERYQANPDMYRNSRLKRKFGITIEQYDEMLAGQGGCCAICFVDEPMGQGRFHVDHDHQTGKVRGLLCHGCNTALGLFRENATLLRMAAEYLEVNS